MFWIKCYYFTATTLFVIINFNLIENVQFLVGNSDYLCLKKLIIIDFLFSKLGEFYHELGETGGRNYTGFDSRRGQQFAQQIG